MAHITYTSNSKDGNYTLRVGGSVSFSGFSKTDGTAPPTGSTLSSVTVTFSKVTTWGSRTLTCTYGTLDFSRGLSGSSLSGTLDGASASVLKYSGGSLSFSVTGSSSSSDIISFRSGCTCTIKISYTTSKASTGELDRLSVAQGSAITLSINSSADEFSHKVVWSATGDGNTQDDPLDSGVYSSTFTIPTAWPVGDGKATLYTYFAGEQVGSAVSYPFTIVVDPKTISPVAGTLSTKIVQSNYIPSDWGGVYVQGYSKCKLTLTGSSPGTGLSYQSIDFAVGSQSISTANTLTYTTPRGITEHGTVTCKASVTNTNGIKANAASKTISVYEYSTPVINTLSAFRCNSSGVPTDKGQYIAVRVICTCSSVGGKNSFSSIQAQYAAVGSTTWSKAVNAANNSTTVISGALALGTKYNVRLTIKDQIQNLAGTSTTSTVAALTTSHVIFCADGGINVCFGCENTTTQNAVIISSDWKLYHGTTELSGTVAINRGGTGATTVAGARNALGLGNTTGAVPVANGGTGATTAAGARNALGLGNTDGAVPVANGGTGATSMSGARANLGITLANLGAAAATHNHSASQINSGTISTDRLPFKVQSGTTTVSGVSWKSVSLSGFSNTPVVVVSYNNDPSSSGIAPLKIRNVSSSGFDVCMAGSSGSGSRDVAWIAVGT